jgi:hypothetical protein
MKYRDIKRRMKQLAADYLYGMEVYDEFEKGDAEKVNRAKLEIQCELIGRGLTQFQCELIGRGLTRLRADAEQRETLSEQETPRRSSPDC